MILQAKKVELDNLSKDELVKRYLKLQDEYFKAKAEKEKSKKAGKNSRNSSVAPSQDPYRSMRKRSLRVKSGKPSGGQPGHRGATLEPQTTPDIEIKHIPWYCRCCGNDLREVEGKLEECRQVVDIPKLELIYTEHQLYSKKCSCGKLVKSDFPRGVNARIQYGSKVMGLVAYLSVRQYISYNRISEFFTDVFSHPLSEGGIQRLLKRIGQRSALVYRRIQDNISSSDCVGADETGARIMGGKNGKGWFWTWQDKSNTFIVASFGRGYQTVLDYFPDGFQNAALVSDCWSAHLKTKARIHQLCIAHLLRDLKYLISLSKNKWPIKIRKLFLEAIEIKRQMSPQDYSRENPKVLKLQNRLDRLLKNHPKSKNPNLIRFFNRLEKHKDKLFPFLFYEQIPPDNNASERAIRNIKVKQKVSGWFRSMDGAQTFAIIRSVIDTSIKRGNNVIESLNYTAQWGSR